MRLHCNNVEMSADVMLLNEVPCAVDNIICTALEKELINVIRCYVVRGFNIILITVDMQFKSLKDRNKVGVKFNVVSKSEHASIIEQYYRVIEEQHRCYYSMLPCNYLPRQIVIGMMKTLVFYINAFV